MPVLVRCVWPLFCDNECMGRFQLEYAVKHRPGRMVLHAPREIGAEYLIIRCFPGIRVRQKRLDLGSKQERSIDPGVIERFDTEPVPCTEELLCLFIPEGKCPHTIEPLEAPGPPFLVGMQDYLGI